MEMMTATPTTSRFSRKKWVCLVCSALIIFLLSLSSVYSFDFFTFARRSFGKHININGKINKSQINAANYFADKNYNCSRYVSVGKSFSKGLGNQMFYFAAAVHVADLTGREVVLFDGHSVRTLDTAFDLKVTKLKVNCPKYNFDEATLSFDARLENLVVNNSETLNKSIAVNGYFQSWRYSRFTKDRIRHHYCFRPHTRQVAVKFLIVNIPPGWGKQFLRVGIHVRRGDFLDHSLMNGGFTVATEAYFQKAMKYFVEKYGRVQFIVASLDRVWATTFVRFNDSALANITFTFGHTAAEDMAILSMCDHVIVSTGSYGWWSGWLAGGTTIYYADYPRRNSVYSIRLKREDYYPTNWIPME